VRSYCEHVGEHIGSNKNSITPPFPQKKKKKNLSPLGVYCLTSLAERNVLPSCVLGMAKMDVYLSME
jgi:hypothetical protein